MVVADIIERCRTVLAGHYGSQLKGLVLYGSEARHEAGQESDINLLVLLIEPFDYFDELRRIIDILYPIQLESDRLISAKPASVSEYEHGSVQLYRNARREGVLADVLVANPEEGSVGDPGQEWAEIAKRRDREVSEGRVQCRSHRNIIASAQEAIRCTA